MLLSALFLSACGGSSTGNSAQIAAGKDGRQIRGAGHPPQKDQTGQESQYRNDDDNLYESKTCIFFNHLES